MRTPGKLNAYLERKVPLFNKFCDDAFPDDEEAKRGLLLILGYCFLPHNPYQRYFFFEGIAGGGKGTFAELILDLVGRGHNGAKLDFDRMLTDAWLGPIRGRTVVVIDEAEGQDIRSYRKVMRELARVTGSEYASSRRLNEDARDVFVGQKFIVISNRQIDADDPTGQQARRVVPVYFGHKPEGRLIENLYRKISTEEGNLVASCAFATYLDAKEKYGSSMFESIESEAFRCGKERFSESTAQLGRFLKQIVVPAPEGVNLASELLIVVAKVWADSHENTRHLGRGIDKRVVSEMRALDPDSFRAKLPVPVIFDTEEESLRRRGFAKKKIDCQALIEATDMTPREILRELRSMVGNRERIWNLIIGGLGFSSEDFDAVRSYGGEQGKLFEN